ncbi:MAG: four helix bundle protein [Cyclobacteriaceae bacterium]|nr:four helix bundle protein [Cyclobacteriaceae bacterium]
MHRFKELLIWQKSIDLAKDVYKITILFPKEEKFGFCSQITRSAVSIPSNIAEGAGRNSNKEFIQFISVAVGSLYELETQLIIAYQVGYIHNEVFEQLSETIQDIGKMLYAFKKSLEKS